MADELTLALERLKGKKIVGYLYDAFPISNPEKAKGTKAIVFDDGQALVVGLPGQGLLGGSIWIEPAKELHAAIAKQIDERNAAAADAGRLSKMGQELPPLPPSQGG